MDLIAVIPWRAKDTTKDFYVNGTKRIGETLTGTPSFNILRGHMIPNPITGRWLDLSLITVLRSSESMKTCPDTNGRSDTGIYLRGMKVDHQSFDIISITEDRKLMIKVYYVYQVSPSRSESLLLDKDNPDAYMVKDLQALLHIMASTDEDNRDALTREFLTRTRLTSQSAILASVKEQITRLIKAHPELLRVKDKGDRVAGIVNKLAPSTIRVMGNLGLDSAWVIMLLTTTSLKDASDLTLMTSEHYLAYSVAETMGKHLITRGIISGATSLNIFTFVASIVISAVLSTADETHGRELHNDAVT